MIHTMLVNSRKWIATLTVIAMAMTGCTDDDLLPKPGTDTDMMFNITIPSSWGQLPAPASAPAPEVTINPISSSDNDTLYLVSRAYTLPDSIVPVKSRGSQINDTEHFHAEAGLSAICYTGTYPADETQNEWTTNMGHDIKLNTKTGKLEKTLTWPGTGKIRFFAYAPYGGATHSSTGHKGSPSITFTVNTDPEKQVDLMTAATPDVSGSQNSSVTLHFRHALTGIMFKAKDGMLSGTVNGITISGVHGSGTHIIGSDKWTTTDDTYDYELKGPFTVGTADDNYAHENENKDNLKLTDESRTLFLIPQTLPEGAEITVSFTDNLTNTERTLTADLTGTWQPGKLVVYSISTSGIVVEPMLELNLPETKPGVYAFSDTYSYNKDTEHVLPYSGVLDGVTMKAYIEVTQSGADTKRIPTKVRFESVLADGTKSESEFVETSLTQENADYMKAGYICMTPQPVFNEMRKFGDNLNKYNGSKEKPFDLSTNGDTELSESSNCYVVNTPGYYKIPVVYGNSLDNPDAYKGSTANNNVWANFKDHTNSVISNAWINETYTVKEAKLVWQDSPGLVTNINLTNDGKYIEFEVREASMNQGNALIAVRDEEETIIWSWHIYVTHYDWSTNSDIKVTAKGDDYSDESMKTHYLAPCNIGYCDLHGGNESRSVTLNIYVTLPNGNENLMKTHLFKQEPIIASAAGDNTYYQWGRKDPMLPGIYNSNTSNDYTGKIPEEFDMINKPYFPANGYKFLAGQSPALFSQATCEPNVFYMNNYEVLPEKNDKNEVIEENKMTNSKNDIARRHWHKSLNNTDGIEYGIYNAWDINRFTKGEQGKLGQDNDGKVIKSVYDPSPRGYNVPHSNAFTALTTLTTIASNGFNHYWKKQEDESYKDILTEVCSATRIQGEGGHNIGWNFKIEETSIIFYSTGVRDMGYSKGTMSDLPAEWKTYSWPAFKKITFIATATTTNKDENTSSANPQCMLFSMDERHEGVGLGTNAQTNNAYGFSIRPERIRK